MGYQKKSADSKRSSWNRGIRKGFDATLGVSCEGCFAYRNEIQILKEENKRLSEALKRSNGGKQIANGAHTPSSRLSHRKNTAEENRKLRGGARKGHEGHGRKSCAVADADDVIEIRAAESCEDCQCSLTAKDFRQRTVVDCSPIISRKIVYRLQRATCPKCHRQYRAQAPVLPKNLYGNALLSQAATMHYQHGVPLGRVVNILGPHVTLSGLVQSFHRLGTMAASCRPSFIDEFRRSTVRHADETGWRNDGSAGYVWLFSTPKTSLFEFRATRGSIVPKEIIGQAQLPGVLVVDRYAAYNSLPIALQYCFAHLLREVEKTAEDFNEVNSLVEFCGQMAFCLTRAMQLRKQPISDKKYYTEAKRIKAEIETLVHQAHFHMAVKNIQNIFRDPKKRLFHWVKDRNVPADNNRAERELRPTVIARKVSFGSQSDAGAKTRGSMMSLFYTVAKRLNGQNVQWWLKESLDQIARAPSTQICGLLPP